MWGIINMETNYLERINRYLNDYLADKAIIDRQNAIIDNRVQEEKNKESSLGGEEILNNIKATIRFIRQEYDKFDFVKIIDTVNSVPDLKEVSIKEISEEGHIFDGVISMKSMVDRFFSLANTLPNMLKLLIDNSFLTDEQCDMLSTRLGELKYYAEHIKDKTRMVYENEIVPVREAIAKEVESIEVGKQDNERFLESKKAIFRGEVEEILLDFNFFYRVDPVASKDYQVDYVSEYKFDAFLVDNIDSYSELVSKVASVDSELASRFICNILTQYDSTKAKTYIFKGEDKNKIKDIYRNIMINYVRSYPNFNNKIIYFDDEENEFLKKIYGVCSEFSYSSYTSTINKEDRLEALKDIKGHIDEVNNVLKESGEEDIFIYNASHKDNPLDIILLLISNLDDIDEESKNVLLEILKNNNRCGVITFINLKTSLEGLPTKGVKSYNINKVLPLDNGEFKEEEFFEGIHLLTEFYKK